MKLTLALLLVCVSVMVCVAIPAEQSIYSSGQATGINPTALSEAYEDYIGRLAVAMSTSDKGSAVASSGLRTKEIPPMAVNPDEEEYVEINPKSTA